jgi:hypothetical protein
MKIAKAIIVAIFLVGPIASRTTSAADAINAVPPTALTWWNTGDSYAAGEGLPGAAGQCQQSPKAFGPKAIEILTTQRQWSISQAPFSACTGDVALDQFMSRSYRKRLTIQPACQGTKPGVGDRLPNESPTNDQSLADWAASQAGWTDNGRFDVITLSMGGNDFCFADIVTGCAGVTPDATSWPGQTASYLELIGSLDPQGRCEITEDELRVRIDALVDGGQGGIPKLTADGPTNVGLPSLWRKLIDEHLAKDGTLVVAGYPRLITPSKTWGSWRGDRCNTIQKADADMLGDAAEYLDQKLATAVSNMSIGGNLRYVSRLKLFDSGSNYHSLCAKGPEWINTIFLSARDGTMRVERAFHPNQLGHTATAEIVAGEVEQHQQTVTARNQPVTAPPTTSQSTIAAVADLPTTVGGTQAAAPKVGSGEQTYEIGSPFAAQCTIAWPTAPSIGRNSIEMRTFCPSVPQQFLFVDIAYGDPELPVSPSRATMNVKGEVVDIVRNELGFTVLVVIASDIKVLA